MKILRKKLKSRRGFSLAELLLVVLILMLVGTIATVGISSAKSAYEKVVDGANAQLLLSTTVSSLRRELALASEVKTSGTAVQSYTNGETGYSYTLKCGALGSAYPGIYRELQNSEMTAYSGTGEKPCELLVTEKAATKNMVVSFSSISYDKTRSVFTVSGLKVEKNGKVMAGLDQPLAIRAVTGIKETST